MAVKKTKSKTKAVQATKKNLPAAPAPDNMQLEINPQALIDTAMSKGVDVNIIEKLLDMRDRLKKEQAEQAFRKAMSHFQANCPIIVKTKAVLNKDKKSVRYKYAPLDAIVKQVQPLLGECQLSYDIDTSIKDNLFRVEIVVSHILGHSKTSSFEIPIDKEDFMSAPQKYAARCTFAKRYAFQNGFGILTGDLDTDDGGIDDIDDKPKAALKIDAAKLMAEAADLIGSSQSFEQLNHRGNKIIEIVKQLSEADTTPLREQLKQRRAELMEKEKKSE